MSATVAVLRIDTPRPALVRVHESTDDDGATVDVSLASPSGTRVGSASGEASASHRPFLVATATLRAIPSDLADEFQVVAATTTASGSDSIAIVIVEAGTSRLVGSALIEDDNQQIGFARAALDAVNRRLETPR